MAKTTQTGDERNQTNPGKFVQNRAKRAKLGKIGQKQAFLGKHGAKRGKKRAKSGKNKKKTGKKQANKTKPWQKQDVTESFAKTWFGFGHPWTGVK